MEVLPSGGKPINVSLELVDVADVYIIILAHRYGLMPEGYEVSFTEAEYDRACERQIPILPFLIDDDYPVIPSQIDKGSEGIKLDILKRRIKAEHVVKTFTDAHGLEGLVCRALQELESGILKSRPSESVVSPPHPSIDAYITHTLEATRKVSLMGLGSKLGDVSLPIHQAWVELETQAVAPSQDDLGHSEDPRGQTIQRMYEGVRLTDLFPVVSGLPSPRKAVLILGDPGSGKTTVTKRLFWEIASGNSSPESFGLHEGTIPVLLKLQHFLPNELLHEPDRIQEYFCQSSNLLREFLCKQTLCPDLPEDLGNPGDHLWRRGKLLWILDGLDEIPSEVARNLTLRQIAKCVDARHELMRDRFLVTSRFSGTDSQSVTVPDCFLRFHVKSLDSGQREELVGKFFHAVAPVFITDEVESEKVASERAKGLLSELKHRFNQPRIGQISSNPLILTIICVVYWDRQRLPQGPADLFGRCLDVFLEHWPTQRFDSWDEPLFDPVKARRVLSALAWWLHENKKRGATLEDMASKAEDLLRIVGDPVLGVDGKSFVEEQMGQRCGIIVNSAGQREFLHLTFQEFLTASFGLAKRWNRKIAAGIAEKWWHEPAFHALRLGAEADSEEFFDSLLSGGGLESVLEDEEEMFDHAEVFGELIAATSELPSGPFLEFLEGEFSNKAVRVVLKGLRLRTSLDRRLVEAIKQYGNKTDDLESRLAIDTLLQREGLSRDIGQDEILVYTCPKSGIAFVRVKAGAFYMGTDISQGDYPRERPKHRVKISKAMWVAAYPVTNEQYARYLEDVGEIGRDRGGSKRPQHPAVDISWIEAQQFCDWAECRLLTEAEWEYACRAGSETKYCFGERESDLWEYGWFEKNSNGRPHDVGTKKPNRWGLYDMHGNVREWCQEGLRVFGSDIELDPFGPNDSPFRVVRGGSFKDSAYWCRSACRYRWTTSDHYADLGFRVCLLDSGKAEIENGVNKE